MRFSFRRSAFGALMVLSGLPGLVRADEGDVTLEYRSNVETCPTEAVFRDRIAARLGQDPFSVGGSRRLRIEISESPGLVAAVTLIGDEVRVRALTAQDHDCSRLVDEVVLAVSVALDSAIWTIEPSAGGPSGSSPDEVSPSVAPEEEELPPAMQPPPAAAVPEPEAAAADYGRVDLAVAAGVSIESSPGISLLSAASVGVRWTHVRIALGFRFDALGEKAIAGGTLRAQLLVAEARGCGQLDWFFACTSVLVGALFGEGVDAPDAQSFSVLQAAVGLATGATVWVDPIVGLFGEVSIHVPVTYADLVQGGVSMWRTPYVFGGLAAGVRIVFDGT